MSIEQEIVKLAILQSDIKIDSVVVQEAVNKYLCSEDFQDQIAESLEEKGIGYELGKILGEKLSEAIKSRCKITVEL